MDANNTTETTMTKNSKPTAPKYIQVAQDSIPQGLVWMAPARHQGQLVVVEYSNGIPAGRRVNYTADEGDMYKRVIERSRGGAVTYYRLSDA